MDTGHWTLSEGVNLEENPFGFVYLITNKATGRKYVGKKQMVSKRTRKPLKGKKNKRRDVVESDWKTYTSSSREINEDLIKYGKEQFEFIILRICNSKWENAYYEIKEQIERNVLLDDSYYNGIINVRIGTPNKETKEKFLASSK